jgi:hypothetical protein
VERTAHAPHPRPDRHGKRKARLRSKHAFPFGLDPSGRGVHQASRSRCEKQPFRLTGRRAFGKVMTPIDDFPGSEPDVNPPFPAGFSCLAHKSLIRRRATCIANPANGKAAPCGARGRADPASAGPGGGASGGAGRDLVPVHSVARRLSRGGGAMRAIARMPVVRVPIGNATRRPNSCRFSLSALTVGRHQRRGW